jgi:hypothetical protein
VTSAFLLWNAAHIICSTILFGTGACRNQINEIAVEADARTQVRSV